MTSEVVLLVKTSYYHDTVEWIEWYKKLGFDHITIYDNESTIDFNTIIVKYSDYVTYNKIVGFPDQLKLELEHYNKTKYDYVFFADSDEFLWIDPKYKNINDFIQRKTTELNCKHLAIYWTKISGNPCPETRADSPETTQIKCFKYVQEIEIDSWTKCIYKTHELVSAMCCHYSMPITDIKDINGNCLVVENVRKTKYDYKNDDALIYHYYHKSYKEYTDKVTGTYAPEKTIVKDKFPDRYHKTFFNYLKLLYNIGYCKYDNTPEKFLY